MNFPSSCRVSPAKMGDVYTFSAFVRDVTEQKRAETQLRDSEERYRSVVTASDEGVLLSTIRASCRRAIPAQNVF